MPRSFHWWQIHTWFLVVSLFKKIRRSFFRSRCARSVRRARRQSSLLTQEARVVDVYLPRSSTLSIGVTNFSTVRKATRLAVYDDTKIREKYHHEVAAMRPENDLGTRLIDCLMNEAKEKNRALDIPKRWTSFCFRSSSFFFFVLILSSKGIGSGCRAR